VFFIALFCNSEKTVDSCMATALADPLVTWEETEVEDPSLLMALSRVDRARIAEDTLKQLEAGGYRARGGVPISFGNDIAFTLENSVLYTEDDLRKMKAMISTADDSTSASSTSTKFEVLHCTTLQAALSLSAKVDEDRIGVLNFASAKNPGGGFLRGANAQEESIARSSSLYLALTEERFINGFYDYNRRGRSGVYSDRLIYSPRVTVFKVSSDRNNESMISHVPFSSYRMTMETYYRLPITLVSSLFLRRMRVSFDKPISHGVP
jgi:uncharacterized protein (TIGR02452 family)